MPYEHIPPPPTPPKREWRFVAELSNTPYHQPLCWKKRKARPGEASLAAGVRLNVEFPDPRGLLETAYADFAFFLSTAKLKHDGGYPIRIRQGKTSVREEYRVEVAMDAAVLTAADTDGVRRGLIWIEDEMQRRGGPFLPIGTIGRKPWVYTRISRCFFGPISRPPKSRKELADDVDYYPEEYLNRLAHEGVNGLWLTINWFSDLPSTIIPEYGHDSARRLAKLRRTAEKCARYGIRIYVFCIEPAGFINSYTELKAGAAAAAAHPDLVGHNQAFCISTDKGKAYVEEATRTLFTVVPELGGLIVISVGERQTHCYSFGWDAPGCPRCKDRDPIDVLGDTLAAMRRGMDAVNPAAELISWPYSQYIVWNPTHTAEAAGRVPANVCLQHNFESGGWNEQLGKRRLMWDYWQSIVGPADLFRKCAKEARAKGTRIFAKLQVAGGHEITTTQYVPVPGIIHQKYRQMRKLGVTGAMLSWYPGAYPCLMTRASSELSFEPASADERTFLLDFARRDWGKSAPQVVKAWKLCEEGYKNYPTAHDFQFFGPMHEGVVWPLYLVPRRRPLSPFWQLHYPPSGDYIAECITSGFTYDEILILCKRMAGKWAQGARIMKRLLPRFQHHPDRQRDILVTLAIGCQFRSGYNILRFYALRENLVEVRTPAKRLALLRQMKAIVREELAIDKELLPMVEAEPILGFNAEAEGYKYWPDMIRWRMGQLQGLLREEFPEVERLARAGVPLFPDYTGAKPAGAVYTCHPLANAPAMDGRAEGAPWDALPQAECTHWLHQKLSAERQRKSAYDTCDHLPLSKDAAPDCHVFWQAGYDATALYFGLLCRTSRDAGQLPAPFQEHSLLVYLEPKRTLPRIIFALSPDGAVQCVRDDGYIPRPNPGWQARSRLDPAGWSAILRLPFRALGLTGSSVLRSPIRINVLLSRPLAGQEGMALCSWVKTQPVKGRLVWGYLNPATDFGWLKPG